MLKVLENILENINWPPFFVAEVGESWEERTQGPEQKFQLLEDSIT
jgi:hypothetical protein